MNRFTLVVWLCFSASASAQTIPIESVWSNGIKGTKDIGKLEPPNTNKIGGRQPKYPVLRAINSKLTMERNMFPTPAIQTPAIVVAGKPSEALAKIRAVAIRKPEVEQKFTTADELNFFFYTKPTATNLVLDAIYIKGNSLFIDYHHVSHMTMETKSYMGLIPLGKLPAGEYRVSFHRNKTLNEKGELVSNIILAEHTMCRGVLIQINRE